MQKRPLICFVLALMFIITTSLVSAQSSDLTTSFASRSNLRAGPSVEWTILGTFDAGTTIRLDGQRFEGDWARGILPNGSVGWVYHQALSISREEVASLRNITLEEPFTLGAPQQQHAIQSSQAPAEQAPAPQQQTQAPAAPVAAPSDGIPARTYDRVNMRANPSGSVLRTLDMNQNVTVDGRNAESDWLRVITSDGARGWVFADFISISPSEIASLPVTQGGASDPGVSAPAQQAPAAAPPPVVNTAPVRGFQYGGHVSGFGEVTANWMHYAGMTWVKKQLRYQVGQDPSSALGLINDAHSKGFRILLGIVGSSAEVNNPGYFEQYASFVGGVAALGADAIEVWNEPNIDREWPNGSIDPVRFTELLRHSYHAIKGANANTMVISGAPAPTGYFGGCSPAGCDDNVFISGMAAAGAANYMDCLGAHYNEGIVGPSFTSGDPRGNSGHYTRYYQSMVNTYHAAIGGRRPICFTELGYLSPEGFPPLPGSFGWAENVTVAQQAAWLDQVVDMAARSGRIRLLIIWNVDFTNYGADPMAGFAMIRPDGSCPACDALAR